MEYLYGSPPSPQDIADRLILYRAYEQAKELIVKEEIEAYSLIGESYDADIAFFDWLIRENGLSLKALDPAKLVNRLPLLDFLTGKRAFPKSPRPCEACRPLAAAGFSRQKAWL